MSEVLIVEDSRFVAQAIKEGLESHGHTVTVTTSAQAAVEFLGSHVVQAIISDGLSGGWEKVIAEGTLKGIGLLIVLSSENLSQAVPQGVKFFPKQEPVESMNSIFILLSQ